MSSAKAASSGGTYWPGGARRSTIRAKRQTWPTGGLMTSSLTSPPSRAVKTPGTRTRIPMRLIGAIPLWLGPLLYLISPTFFGPKPELLGLPTSLVMLVGAMSWALIGLGIIWDARAWVVDALALVVFTIPALLFMIIGPAILLIVQNLGAY